MHMLKWKNWQIALFVTACVCLNIIGKIIAVWLQLPLWADSFGTALCAYVAGPVCGAIVGLTGNLAYCTVNHMSAAYSITSIALGIIVGIASRRNWFDRFYGFMKAASWAMFTALVVSVPIDFFLNGGYTGNKWGDGVVEYLLARNCPAFVSTALGQLAIEFADKVLTIAAVYLVILARTFQKRHLKDEEIMQGKAAKTAIFALLMLGDACRVLSVRF